ncbi:ATP-binding cassette domain-containing protein [Macrococcus equi]|uniref:ATP-binding cassette domain-containing protein n=1 Tax=Macrococcus equi TaxID=3395462 RepID=UPI0039BE6CF2
MKLHSFTFREVLSYFPDLSNEEVAVYYGVTGGVAEYLTFINERKNNMMLQFKNIHKQMKDTTLIDIDQLKIDQGEKIGLIGKNGCGKSTLLKMIAAIDNDYSGLISNPFQTQYVPLMHLSNF